MTRRSKAVLRWLVAVGIACFVLDVARAGPQTDSFDEFVELLTQQIRVVRAKT